MGLFPGMALGLKIFGVGNLLPLVEIGLTDLPESGGGGTVVPNGENPPDILKFLTCYIIGSY